MRKTSNKTQGQQEYILCYDVLIKTLLIETEREIIIVIFHEATALFPVSFNTSSAVAEDSRDWSVPASGAWSHWRHWSRRHVMS